MIYDLTFYQLILACLALFYVFYLFLRFIRRESSQTFLKFFFSELIWVSIFILSVFPGLPSSLSHSLGFGENLNTLIFIGFIVVFIVIFKLLSIVEKLEANITDIVRKNALKDIEKDD